MTLEGNFLIVWLVFLLSALPMVALAATTKSIPMRDFFRNVQKGYFRLSPDGKYIAFMQPYESRMNIHVQRRGSTAVKRITGETARDISNLFWKGNNRILYVKDFGGDENFHLVAVDRNGGNLKDLTPFEGVRAQVIDDLRDHPTDVIVGLNKRNKEVFDAYRLNTFTAQLTLVAENPGNITAWQTDHKGNIRVAITSDGVNTSLLYRATEKEPFRSVLTTNFKEQVNPLFFTFDNKHLYAISNIGRDKAAVVEMDPATGKERKVIFQHPEVDVAGMDYSRKRKVLTEIGYTTSKPERKVLDKETAAVYQALEKKLPGYEIILQNSNRAEDIFIVAAHNDRTQGSRYLYEKRGDKLTKVTDLTPWLPESEMAEMKPITYESRDGLTIHGYLTLPKGKEAKNLPVVVNPHGGPWSRNVWGFNSEVQFLANRGYAVLQMNFRGSTGYGRRFWEASFKQWGLKMNDDISDSVQYLVRQGIADPKKVCIYGGSYGGYATLAALAFSPELYACGVDYVGVSNLFTFMKTIPPYWKPYLDMFYEMVGDPEKDKAQLEATSPVFHADQIRAPLLIAQGAKDPRVNINESNQIVEALKQRGIDVPYIVKENEGHGFSNEENRFAFYEAMERFLAKYLN